MEYRKSSFCYAESCIEAGAAAWQKPSFSFSNGNCVEAATAPYLKAQASATGHCVEASAASYGKAQASAGGNCVEHGDHAGMVFVRDSKDSRTATGEFPHLHYFREEWNGGRAVKFTPMPGLGVPGEIRDIAAQRGHDPAAAWYAVTTLRSEDQATILYFDQSEKDAWDDGVENGEFALAEPAAA